ncbi:MAG: kinase [Verrucomicrobia bacterium]|nr:kinase [Verrucomicrobiota bacterium]
MVISRTPFRISFFGGGTDYPAWYRQFGGCVLSATIDKYCYLSCRYLPPFFEHRFRVVYSKIENCRSIDEIAHPAVREILRHLRFDRGLEIHHDGDLPGRSGMGSSSAFTVGLLHALYALKGQIVSKHQLATESIQVEQEILKEAVGSQDQVCAAYGGLNQIHFHTNGDVSVRPVTVSPARLAELNSRLMLFYTGIKRTAADIAASFVGDLSSKAKQLNLMRGLLDQSLEILNSDKDLNPFGELLHTAWQAKRSLSSKVSNSHVDGLYEQARSVGAVGGKLLGAGGGGFLLLFVPPDRQHAVREKLSQLIFVPFAFESFGSQIIFFDPEEDYSEHDRARSQRPVETFRELESLGRRDDPNAP